jgi:ABC-2 type transport system permease protein
MLRPLYIALLELKRYLADRGDLAFSLALPIVLFALMYGVFGGEETFNGTANVVDLDRGPMAQELVSRLEQVDGLRVRLRTEEDAASALDRSAILTAVVIPSGFSEGLQMGMPVSLVFRQRGSGGDEGQIVQSIVRGAAQQMAGEAQVRVQVAQALAGSSASQAQIDATVTRLLDEARRNPPVGVSSRVIGGSSDFVDRLLPGVLVMFLMFAVTLGAQSMVEERRLGTLERLLTTRLSISQLFWGKFLAGAFRATLQALILLSLGFAALRVAGASEFFQALAFSLLIAAAVSAIGLVIGALARSRDQAAWAAVFFTMFMTIFGGTFFDVGDSGPLATLSRFTLNRYAIDALEDILAGGEWLGQQGLEIAVMAGVAIVGLTLARIAFRATEGGR